MKSKSLISFIRTSNLSKFCLFILITNFVNLSANFYEGNIYLANGINMDDPIDTISELIFEWALDGNDDFFPDNGTHQNDNSLEKIKLALVEIFSFLIAAPIFIENTSDFFKVETLISGHFSSDSPPPDCC